MKKVACKKIKVRPVTSLSSHNSTQTDLLYDIEWEGISRDLDYIHSSVLLMQLINAVGGVRQAVTPEGYFDNNSFPPPPDMSSLQISGEYFVFLKTPEHQKYLG